MTQPTCEQCGGTNLPGARVCRHCYFSLPESVPPAQDPPDDQPGPPGTGATATQVIDLRRGPRAPRRPVAQGPPARGGPAARERPAAQAGPPGVGATKAPTVSLADPDVAFDHVDGAGFDLRVLNTSSIVEGYRLDPLSPPPWLTISRPAIRLLPGDQTDVRVDVGARPDTLAPAGRIRLRLRLRPLTDDTLFAQVDVGLTVPPVGGPATIRTDPAVVRLRDTSRGRFTVHLDNAGCNHAQRYTLSGSDDEGVVRFDFTPAVVELAPGGKATVGVAFEAPPPGAGETSTRQLKVRAASEQAGVEAAVTMIQQAAPSDAPVRLRLEPAVLRTADAATAELDVVVDNRPGSRGRRLTVQGRDPEDRIRFTFRAADVGVGPGSETRTRVRLEAPAPAPGTEVARQFTISASDGRQDSEVTGTWVQSASAAPITTAAVRLEPEHVRVRDQPAGRFGVVVDNRRGVRTLRVRLSASDPESVVGFAFHPPALEVGPGGTARAELAVSAPLPPSGQVATRALRVRAADRHGMVETNAVFEQSTSPTPLSTARILLEPQQLVTRNTRNGRFNVQLDNRRGATLLRVRLSGSDPERSVRFGITPGVLDVPPGQVGWAAVTVVAPRADSGQEVTRSIKVVADDGAATIEATGSFVQSSDELRPKLRFLFTLIGGLLVIVGAFLPWLAGDEDRDDRLPTPPAITGSIEELTTTPPPVDVDAAAGLLMEAQPLERAATVLLAAFMVLGLIGVRGRRTRLTGLLIAATMVAASVFYAVTNTGAIGIGAVVVVLGGIVGFVGGMYVKR